jgi:NAD(P)-dependent dehydrogenase (short-subunit alcohol dehydrogenase family)
VFERFTRLDESRDRDGGGAGLGLAIAHEIAVRHGATLSITDSPGGGACLTAATPSAQGPRVVPLAGRRDQPAVRAATPPRGQRIPGRHN